METMEALRELALALAEPEAEDDLEGVMQAWGRMLRGEESAETRAGSLVAWVNVPQPTRRRRILEAAERQAVTSGTLASQFGVSAETVRNDLRILEAQGLLKREGSQRGTRYMRVE